MDSKLRLHADDLVVSSFETADSASAVVFTTATAVTVISAINLCTGTDCTFDYVCLQLTLLAEDCFGPTLPVNACGVNVGVGVE